MPQVFRRTGSPFWYARWQLNGKDHVVSTRKRKKQDAETELERFVAEARDELTIHEQLKGLLRLVEKLPAKDQAAKRQELVRDILAGQERKLPITDGWRSWRDNSNREYDPKESTLKGYVAIWSRFEKWAGARGLKYLHEVNREQTEEYATHLWKSKVSPTTFNAHIKFLRAAFVALESRAGLVGNPWSPIKSKKKNHGEGRRNLNEEELKKVLSRAQGNLKLMLHLGLFTGLRLGDVVNLRWSDIEFNRGFINVVPLKTKRFNKKLEIPIHAALNQLLSEFKVNSGQSEFLFPGERVEYLENAGNVTNPIQEFFQKCGITTTEDAEHGQRRRAIVRVGFHSLRHSFVSMCAKARTPQHVVQHLVGHGSPAMTEHYIHLDPAQKKEAIAALPVPVS